MEPEQPQSEYRAMPLWAGGLLAVAGAAVLAVAVYNAELWPFLTGDLIVGAFGWGPPLVAIKGGLTWLQGVLMGADAVATSELRLLLLGCGVWTAGWALVAAGIRRSRRAPEEKSIAAGAPLHPTLAAYRDFYWGTLFAYGGGILLAELALIFLQTLLASGVPVEGAAGTRGPFQLAPTIAFIVSLVAASGIAFLAGALGAARARRISGPEATIGVCYLGLPIPALLTVLALSPELQLGVGYRLREVVYLASLLGDQRIAVGYWTVFCVLVLMLILGITSGFVVTGTGRVELRAGFEAFVARRHVSVFRPRMILGGLVVLLLGIIPPLIVYAIIRAAGVTAERTRIRKLGLADPLKATEALHRARAKEQTPTEMMTALSMGGVGLGVMALIIVLSVMSGFEVDLQKKILGTNAHAVVVKYADSMPEYKEVMKRIAQVPGVIGQTPFIGNEVMVASEANISGTIIKGVDPETAGKVTDLSVNMLPGGDIMNLAHPEKIDAKDADFDSPGSDWDAVVKKPPDKLDTSVVLPGIIMGRELAQSLRVAVGHRVSVVSPLGGELGPQGPMPKSRPFRVAGIFFSGMYEYDSKWVFISLDEAQKFFGMDGPTGIELKFKDLNDARRLSRAVLAKVGGYPYRSRDWGEMNKNLFSALRLEKLVMAIILSIIVIVAAGLIIATVIMLVLEKRKEISVLKALGVPDGGIVKIFLIEGLQIGVAGGALGLIAGLAWCLFIEKVGVKLDPEVYYISSLPVKIEPLQTAIAVLIAVLVTYLGSIYPALKASKVEPVEGLKAE